jgi:recombinational DNA repair ATPase RecF
MSQPQTSERLAEIHAENIGGIDETTVWLSSGVTVLAGRNATNRTLLLRALMGLGSDGISLKGDANEGRLELALGKEEETQSGLVTTLCGKSAHTRYSTRSTAPQ